MSPHVQLGWRPLLDSYLTSIPDAVREANRDVFSKLIEDNRSLVLDLFSWLVQPCLDFIRHDCRLFVTTSAQHRVSCLLQLYSCLLDNFIDGMDSVSQTQVHTNIVHCIQAHMLCVLPGCSLSCGYHVYSCSLWSGLWVVHWWETPGQSSMPSTALLFQAQTKHTLALRPSRWPKFV